ncbi:MAG: helix-turn-helix transcriptional regulator [Lachnospiraceae bacterium]|nr:helix-turn-helix transcriptional regulator [Lachnospiraceae bacterium]MBR1650103.1 helix-turn-helix transcriptional regulator [Lachnospiraceae bacterium]
MGKKSVRENKNEYQLARENLNLTREAASEIMKYVSDDRIEKIESEKSLPHPDEIMLMAKAYKAPHLCNYFCSHECPIGQENVPELEYKSLAEITLAMLSSLNSMDKYKNRLIEITSNGRVDEDEVEDFETIREKLEQISVMTQSLKLWVDKAIADGKMKL